MMKKIDNIKVSVCIPAYNAQNTIKRAIDSIISQTHSNMEIIIIDDQSLDRTVEIIKEYNDDRIVLIKNDTNLGMVGNWNKCVQLSTCEFIQMVHSDDCIESSSIEKKLELLSSDPSLALVFSATAIIDCNDQIILQKRIKSSEQIIEGKCLW